MCKNLISIVLSQFLRDQCWDYIKHFIEIEIKVDLC